MAGLLTGLCLVTADRLDESAVTRVLAVLAVGVATLALVGAVVGQMTSTLARASQGDGRRRGVRTIAVSGVFAGLAVVLAASAAILVVLRQEARRPDTPQLTFTLVGKPGETALSVQLVLPDLAEGSLVDATLTGMTYDATQHTLARAVVPADAHGLAEARLVAAASDEYRNLVVQARSQRRTCRATLSLEEPIEQVPTLECRTSP
ncbi:hypothetical protein [Actinoplanes aureus]|uniref:Uncharacterized protein n=1 Tax=Actinoplanes aureus TaxID=2792083 RepID=A0A931CIQ2_9ACTN|nr:hypothetical protein [Actinoplanes aureus]MBG0569314.1 hypothetical protein [Actinoplanes aureus]